MPACARGWLDKEMTLLAPHEGRPGRPPVSSETAIQFRRAVDSTGIKFLGDGALLWFEGKPLPGNKWQARKHGVKGRRQ